MKNSLNFLKENDLQLKEIVYSKEHETLWQLNPSGGLFIDNNGYYYIPQSYVDQFLKCPSPIYCYNYNK